jgi:tetratricopeptide (TPR) repeat protein
MPIKNNFFVTLLFFAALGFLFAIYSPAQNAPFLFDDNRMVTDNKLVKDLGHLGDFFSGKTTTSPNITSGGMCRPILMSTFAINYRLNGLNPAGYRIINIILHFINALLLALLLINIGFDPILSVGLAAIFLVHPINSETIICISNRSDLMATLFILATFIFWNNRQYVLFAVAFILALLTKETSLCLPMIIIAWEIAGKNNQKERLPGWVITGIITTLYLIYRSCLFSATLSEPLRPLYDNILMQSAVTVTYFRVFFLFEPNNFFHYVPYMHSIFESEAICGLIFIATMIFSAVFLRKKNKIAAFAIAWALIALLPKFYARLNFPAMEHHFYFASIGIYIFAASFLKDTAPRKLRVLFTGIIAILSLLTFFRSAEFKNQSTFWSVTVNRNPFDAYAHNELGRVWLQKNDYVSAQREFEEALRLPARPADYLIAEKMIAQIFINNKQYAKARKILNHLTALRKPPDGAFEIMGNLCVETGDVPGAIIAWQKEIKLYPWRADTYSRMGRYFLESKNTLAAKKYFSTAISLDPDAWFAYYGAGRALFMENNRHAIEFYRQALKIRSDFSAARLELAQSYIKNDDMLSAIHELEALAVDQNYAGIAYNDTAIAYTLLVPPNWTKAYENAIKAKKAGYRISETMVKTIEGRLKR